MVKLGVAFSALITGVLFSHFNTIINMDLVKEANKQEENVPQLNINCTNNGTYGSKFQLTR